MIKRIQNAIKRTNYYFKQNLRVHSSTPADGYNSKLIEPDENKNWAFRRLTQQSVNNLTVTEALRCLIKTNATLDAIVDTHQTYTVREIQLTHDLDEPGGEQAEEQIREWLDTAISGYRTLKTFAKQCAYYRIVEGGIAIRVIYDPTTVEPSLQLISPLSLVYHTIEENGKKYLIIGKKIKRNEIEVYYDERRSPEENEDFIYVPCNLRGDQVYGSSQLATALRPAYTRQKLSEQLSDYTEKNIYPKVIYFMNIIAAIVSGNMTLQDAKNAAKEAKNILKQNLSDMDDPDNKSDGVSVGIAPVEVVEVTGVSKAKLDGLEVLLDVIEPEIQRAARIPRILLGGQRNRISLNQNDSDTEMTAFAIRNKDGADDISIALTKALKPIRRHYGIDAFVGIDCMTDNIIYDNILLDNLMKRMEAYEKAVENNVIDKDEMKELLRMKTKEFNALPD